MITLDTFCQEKNINPEIIKVDVEGAEIDFLLGAQQTIIKNNPLIYLSLHPDHIKKLGYAMDDLRQYLDEVSYACFTVDHKDNSDFSQKECLLAPKAS